MYRTIKRIYLYRFQLFFWFLLVGFLLIQDGCTSRVEGCLDVAAANFDFSADRSCEDCCTYPLLSISLSQKWNDRNFSTADTVNTFKDKNGLAYKINDLKYFLSSWSWLDSDLHRYSVDSAEISCNGGFLSYTPDIILVDSRQFQYTLGTIRQSPLIDSVDLKLGLPVDLDCIDATSTDIPPVFSSSSPLWDKRSGTRASIRLVLQRDTSVQTLDTLYIHTLQDIGLRYDFGFSAGIPTTIKLTVDYAKWFSNADIFDLNSFQTSIESGVKNSYYKSN
ncbi:MAG: MbnP family protein [Saprospiraceae bacterium]